MRQDWGIAGGSARSSQATGNLGQNALGLHHRPTAQSAERTVFKERAETPTGCIGSNCSTPYLHAKILMVAGRVCKCGVGGGLERLSVITENLKKLLLKKTAEARKSDGPSRRNHRAWLP